MQGVDPERAQRLLKAHSGDQNSNIDLLHRVVSLLSAQQAELGDMKAHVRDRNLPTLGTSTLSSVSA